MGPALRTVLGTKMAEKLEAADFIEVDRRACSADDLGNRASRGLGGPAPRSPG